MIHKELLIVDILNKNKDIIDININIFIIYYYNCYIIYILYNYVGLNKYFLS